VTVAIELRQSFSAPTTTVAFIVDENASGSEVTVRVGEQLHVTLRCSPGTGYSWRIVDDPEPQLSLVSSTLNGRATDKPGSTQTQNFVLRARNRGVKRLRFEYVRPWDFDGAAPVESFPITTHVVG
jgi:predicted secreted protein